MFNPFDDKTMIGEDKYMVVAIVMAIIFAGLGVYLLLLDKKLSKMEKKQADFFKENSKS
ncbi:MAG: CcmD family protein [Lentimicrobiaceae bacterium]|nr:CcmD family protein [Lentimicrobiaceae bacterium]MCB9023155.1 CcmD family protein [Lentimicrobiaceae bacterium]MCO5266072.1 CcmD family protein [Lentimicrobium sp.]